MFGHHYFGTHYWGPNYWGPLVSPLGNENITDTDILNLPVNVMMAGDLPIKAMLTTADVRPMNLKVTDVTRASPARRLKGGRPSFTVRTDKKGYD